MKTKGFTLIELLIVVLIISILAGLLVAVINPAGIRAKARDSQRKADLRKIQSALELYFADNKQYPASSGSGINAGTLPLTPAYMNNIPQDPNGPSYRYRSGSGNQEYVLAAQTEVELDTTDPNRCSQLNNASITPSGISPAANCYGVENP